MQSQNAAELDWRDGTVPVSRQFDDPYFSIENGMAETAYVFLQGNRLPDRFRPDFHIAELGFGTGLNLLMALSAWRRSGQTGRLHFTTFEAYPMAQPDMLRALAAFPEVMPLATELADHLGSERFETDDLNFTMMRGDARDTLPAWQGQADAWFLDGFSPAKNPELWEASLITAVAQHTALGGTAATYTAAGFVRRNLTEAGFTVERIPGYGRKRHMTIAHIPDAR
ncbi:tRNA (5-methylaminomethyl-2-thiouridine)(34)-methyltransferase MnmD [Donghicola mangrovi]|uniref:tRNA (5-methylaminomethyl-2-thiouridine)(34)-methyltransferase MnmD n=1 Tax=Donghicola mangrovi TaxID=2729614 RepID=A0A850Q7J9_9RHOB|nr:tRNA (5-methylaminomethyl-2-thiouridine)(34)-methyltransferase MnmD [Donghicola mangrovi]NVO22329.1 tRNA (5-methylaminomethyl-2-thiouridine)(34)-methyltransferase MnmD [Donghicola mangrovi]